MSTDVYPHIEQQHMMQNEYRDRLIIADSRQALTQVPDKTFQMCVTSPPYWGLRDYNMNGQIGAEETIHEFISDLVAIFREVRRTLKDDGILWLNIGDSYTSGGRTWRDKDKKNPARGMSYRASTPDGLKPKDLIGLPWRLALALQDDGWYLRSDNIWYKPNCQPESVKDRPTRSHEYVFLLSKSEKYYYDYESVKEPAIDGKKVRNRRTVWKVRTKPFKGAHFAVYPPELVEICIKAGSKEGDIVLDPFFGSGTTGVVSRSLGRSYYGIELNSEYAMIAEERLQHTENQVEIRI
ncbi:site-specific DNA-methyltransferase [Salinivibrio siamensis]|uniref:Methyltransferase n=2 Tax=Salinivibrio siamensis TaxID=414286 RepID=A0ABX3K7X9_9GAMM|nr:site-specific DNA-methyltransferase [Salinivibrio siamensis]OOE84209.1 site-specific DNA-methyltransferase [Salinivibrio siamensis]